MTIGKTAGVGRRACIALCRTLLTSSLLIAPYLISGVLVASYAVAASPDRWQIAYYPSLRKLEVRSAAPPPAGGPAQQAYLTVVRSGGTRPVLQRSFAVGAGAPSRLFALPALQDGLYEARLVSSANQPEIHRFKHVNYPWLGNTLGKSDAVYPPFQPVRVRGDTARVVLRDYRMNGFGLWDSVRSEGREILAAPVALHLGDGRREERWRFGPGRWIAKADAAAVYRSEATAPGVRVRATSRIEYDGCMRVEMELLPGSRRTALRHLWLEIPLQDREAPLFHYCAFDGMRRNYAGRTPRGGRIVWTGRPKEGWLPPLWRIAPGGDDGVLWTNRETWPNQEHISPVDFVPYVWLGGGERGLAFFAANDRGYSLDDRKPVETLVRRGDRLILRIDLINTPTVLAAPRRIVFGLMASPTRPMPPGWRNNLSIPPHGGPVVCWGGYICADKYPDGRRFRVVDAIMQVRRTGKRDDAVFERLDRERREPWKKLFGTEPWWGPDTKWFVGQAEDRHRRMDWHNNTQGIYPERVARRLVDSPVETYFEEHASDVTTEEWEVYQDEWRARWPWPQRDEVAGRAQPENNFSHGYQAFPPSYRDFALYYANEWFKRGVGLYFDNTMPYTAYNPLTSDAFVDAKGRLHPACTIWEQRDYYKRVWTLMQEWKRKGTPAPLAFTHHMTNTMVLPFETWNDADLDVEWRWYDEVKWTWGLQTKPIPFPPDLLLTETTGRQTGSFAHALFGVSSLWNETDRTAQTARTEWGMRAVHEILRSPDREPARTLEKALWDFGYGTAACRVVNYWSDDPPIAVSDPQVKWLLLVRKRDRALFLVLQSWRKSDTTVGWTLDPHRLGFTPSRTMKDVETGGTSTVPAGRSPEYRDALRGPYGTGALMIGPPSEAEHSSG